MDCIASRRFVAGNDDGTARLWDEHTATPPGPGPNPRVVEHSSWHRSAVSECGRFVQEDQGRAPQDSLTNLNCASPALNPDRVGRIARKNDGNRSSTICSYGAEAEGVVLYVRPVVIAVCGTQDRRKVHERSAPLHTAN